MERKRREEADRAVNTKILSILGRVGGQGEL